MKKTSKALLLALCAVLLVTASVLGTMAYLTSTATVENTFTVGNVAITMDEKDVTNPDGPRVTKNSYKLLPGKTYTKDPTIHVGAGSEDCYLFVKVENEIAPIEGATTVANQMTTNGWTAVEGATGVYVYTQEDELAKVAGGNNVPVFGTFTVAGTVDNETLDIYSGKTITVTAYAIQADGFEGETAEDIWTTAGFGA